MAMPFDTRAADISWLTDTLATGGDLQADHQLAALQCADLVKQGVTHVIDCRLEFDDRARMQRFAPSISYARFGVDDERGAEHTDDWWEAIYLHAQEALSVPGAKLFVHCHVGMNRGPSAAYMLLVSPLFRLTPAEAFDLVRRQRPIANMAYAEQGLTWLAKHDWSGVVESDILRARGSHTWTQALTNEVNHRHRAKALGRFQP